jgi:hypothetical protein
MGRGIFQELFLGEHAFRIVAFRNVQERRVTAGVAASPSLGGWID